MTGEGRLAEWWKRSMKETENQALIYILWIPSPCRGSSPPQGADWMTLSFPDLLRSPFLSCPVPSSFQTPLSSNLHFTHKIFSYEIVFLRPGKESLSQRSQTRILREEGRRGWEHQLQLQQTSWCYVQQKELWVRVRHRRQTQKNEMWIRVTSQVEARQQREESLKEKAEASKRERDEKIRRVAEARQQQEQKKEKEKEQKLEKERERENQ